MGSPTIDARIVDITTLDVDAIVNAANDRLLPGGGVCGAIHRAAGPELARECAAIGSCRPGGACITPGFALRARHVIHAVGPVWRGGDYGEAKVLADAYHCSLLLAGAQGLTSIAFPAISTGIYGYPLEAAMRVAVESVRATLPDVPSIRWVTFACFSAEAFEAYLAASVKKRAR